MKALIIEDDRVLAVQLKEWLIKKGLRVYLTDQVESAIAIIDQHQFTLAIIDRGLPDGDGLEVVEYLNELSYQTKVLVLTHSNYSPDRIKGLTKGADAYLGKPFSHQELNLVIDKLLHRHKERNCEIIKYENITLNLNSGELSVDQHQTRLRPREAAILACLMIHRQTIVTHRLLIDYVWGPANDVPMLSSLAVYIRRIRMALGPARNRLITARSVGYSLK